MALTFEGVGEDFEGGFAVEQQVLNRHPGVVSERALKALKELGVDHALVAEFGK